jgi:hypothetical protein
MIKKSIIGKKDERMKKWLLIVTFATMLIIGLSSQVQAGSQDFTLTNMTGVDIYELYIAPSYSNNWEDEILGQDILKDGDSINIHFNYRFETYWDIMIKDRRGNSVFWRGLNLRRINRITLYMNGNHVWADWE